MGDAPRRAIAWGISMLALLPGCLCYRESNPRFTAIGEEEWMVCGDVMDPGAFPPSVREVLAREIEAVARRPDQ